MVLLLQKSGEGWGDPWPTPDSSITVNNVHGLIRALQEVQSQKDMDEW